jgi:hypothetical protein
MRCGDIGGDMVDEREVCYFVAGMTVVDMSGRLQEGAKAQDRKESDGESYRIACFTAVERRRYPPCPSKELSAV